MTGGSEAAASCSFYSCFPYLLLPLPAPLAILSSLSHIYLITQVAEIGTADLGKSFDLNCLCCIWHADSHGYCLSQLFTYRYYFLKSIEVCQSYRQFGEIVEMYRFAPNMGRLIEIDASYLFST